MPPDQISTPASSVATNRPQTHANGVESESLLGVSIVICCHNGARRLPDTLRYLAAQKTDRRLCWEVVVVDNASRDDTVDAARASWPKHHPVPLRVVYEPQLGLSNARERGFDEAGCDIVAFVDDDNWLCAEWVQTVAEIMSRQTEIGACGGPIEAVCEVSPPPWFTQVKNGVAPPPPRTDAGDISDSVGALCGAGLAVRRSAWRRLREHGFRFLLRDRHGASVSAGGDTELCFALRLAGWKIWYDPRLRLNHFIPRERLGWNRWRSEARGAGMAYPVLALYAFAFDPRRQGWAGRLEMSWPWQTLAAAWDLLRRPVTPAPPPFSGPGWRDRTLAVEVQIGRLLKLWEMRRSYARTLREIETAPWRQDRSAIDRSVQ
jgi:glycosyltransferase involved in cell wall biosynthesis